MATVRSAATTQPEDAPRKNRSGSETRRRDNLMPLRMTTPDRNILDALARQHGFKSTQEFVWSRLTPELEEARQTGLSLV